MYNFISDRGCVIAADAGCCRLALETSAGDGSTPPLSAARKEREKTHMAQWRARLAGWMSEEEEEEFHKKVTARMRIH